MLGLGALTLAAACGPLSPEASVPGAAPAYGEAFTLKAGESVTVGPERVQVGFSRVTSDSRCPRDVQCIQAGEASVLATVTPPGGATAQLELKTTPGGASATAVEYVLTLSRLEPVPVSTRETRPADYRATLMLTRTGARPTP
jgi:hypothetical protein